MFGLSPWELLLIFLAMLLLFGARRLPEIGSSLGKGIREFKDSIKDVEGEVRREITGTPETHAQPAPTPEKEPVQNAQTGGDA